MYLKFFGRPYLGPGGNGGINPDVQQPSVIVQLGISALDITSSADLPECDQMYESEAEITDENMDDSGEADERVSVQRRPEFLSETSFSEGEIHQSEQIIPPISRESIPFQGELEQQQSRNMPTSSASAMQEQEHQPIQEQQVEQLREESLDELNRREEDHVQVHREERISRHPEQACEEDCEEDHLPGLDPSVILAGEKECQTRRRMVRGSAVQCDRYSVIRCV